ncbi:hypothetical protein J6590_039113 [Homalodisca vitripennis]|nr:hypothetical protein J6590_039113 [Homalodisca vitripennis]
MSWNLAAPWVDTESLHLLSNSLRKLSEVEAVQSIAHPCKSVAGPRTTVESKATNPSTRTPLGITLAFQYLIFSYSPEFLWLQNTPQRLGCFGIGGLFQLNSKYQKTQQTRFSQDNCSFSRRSLTFNFSFTCNGYRTTIRPSEESIRAAEACFAVCVSLIFITRVKWCDAGFVNAEKRVGNDGLGRKLFHLAETVPSPFRQGFRQSRLALSSGVRAGKYWT